MMSDSTRSAFFYKLVAALVFLALAAAAAVALLTAAGAISPSSFEGSFGFLRWPLEQVNGLAWPRRLAAAGLAFISGLLFLTLVIRLFKPASEEGGWHVLSSDDRGFVAVDTRGIASIAEQAAMSAHGVIDARVRVRGTHRSPIRLRVDISTYPGANVKRSGLEAREAVVEAIEELVGIDVRDVVIKARVVAPDVLIRGLR